MKFQTNITQVADNRETIAGYELTALATQVEFSDAIWLLLRGELPTSTQAKLFKTILTSAIDHGPGTASAQTARIVASAKTSIQAAVAAGLLAMGERHGAALDNAAHFFVENRENTNLAELVSELKSKKIRLPGFGHAVLTKDHRSETLLAIAKETGFFGSYCQLAQNLEIELNKISSKPLPLNVDGAMAALLLELGFVPGALTGIFIIARTPGLVAQATEEMTTDVGLRRLSEDEIEYTGLAIRKIGV